MKIRTLYILTLIVCSCATKQPNEQRTSTIDLYYDSIAKKLFLDSPEIKLQSVANIDSLTIQFFNKEDFESIVELRRQFQIIEDSLSVRFKLPRTEIRENEELKVEKAIFGYDSLMFDIVTDKYFLNGKKRKQFDSLRIVIGVSPATIIKFHEQTQIYRTLIERKHTYSPEKQYKIITYYVSEMSEFPYPKVLFRLYIDDKNRVRDYGKHYDYDKAEAEETISSNVTAANNISYVYRLVVNREK